MTRPDPPRLFESSTTPAELRSLLELAHEDVLDTAAVERVVAGVHAEIGGTPSPTDPSSPAGGAAGPGTSGSAGVGSSSAMGKLGAAVVVAAMAVGGLWLARERSSEPSPPAEPTVATQVLPSAMPDAATSGSGQQQPAPERFEPSTSDAVDPATPSAPSIGTNAATRASPLRLAPSADAEPARASPADLLEEHQLLRSARAALASDPARALAITEEHRRRFPHGMLAQEREVIAIEALSRLGRSAAARSRADRFDEQYPDSPHRTRVDAASVGRGGAGS